VFSFKKMIALVVLCLSTQAFSYSYSILPPITGKGNLTVNPVFFADQVNSGGMELFAYYGLTDQLDINFSLLTYNGASNFATMLRYDFGGSKILGLRANTSWISPQVNYSVESSWGFLQTTAAVQWTYDYYKEPAFYALFCPGLNFFKVMDVYCEVNPGYYMHDGDFANLSPRVKGFDLDIVPGIGFVIGDALFSIGVPIYCVVTGAVPTVGAWFAYTIAAKQK
jgi:hypothetical protein